MRGDRVSSSQPESLSFTVDTHLLRELGALLVGRDSTALLELIKNSYDADATVVTIHAENLQSPDGRITIVDDGNGMTFETFRDSFLRIAGREKEGGATSPRFGRRLTGAKGIGRLAAHKLAGSLHVQSVPNSYALTDGEHDGTVGVDAHLYWDAMEHHHSDLSDLGESLLASRIEIGDLTSHGTSMTLTGVREEWSPARIGPFLEEIQHSRPPALLYLPLPSRLLTHDSLLHSLDICESGSADPGFRMDLTGDLEPGDDLWPLLLERSDYVIEIDASPRSLRYSVVPTRRTVTGLPEIADPEWAQPYRTELAHPSPESGPFFQARIFLVEGSVGRSTRNPFVRFSREESGIRVFMEGFRVLPYGTSSDDWLRIDQDYVRKNRELRMDVEEFRDVENPAYLQLGNRQYYGGVFLTHAGTPGLQALVNREGFVPDDYFQQLTSMVRSGVDLATRVRAALARKLDEAKRRAKEADLAAAAAAATSELTSTDSHEADDDADRLSLNSDAGTQAGSTAPGLTDSPPEEVPHQAPITQELRSLVSEVRLASRHLGSSTTDDHASAMAARALDRIETRLGSLDQERLELRTLAGVGTQFSAFIHEVNGLLGAAQLLRNNLDSFPDQSRLSANQRTNLRAAQASSDELVQTLTRQVSYLTDVVGPDARRRRRRLQVRERVESALRLLNSRIVERRLRVLNEVPDSLESPPIFAAELTIVFTNLLSNAAKFAGVGGTILIESWLDEEMALWVRVQNTGVPVAPVDRERFFEAYESQTVDVDVVLGQGMGLGLPIVRSLLGDYGGIARFVDPDDGYATAVEVVLPDSRPDIARKKLARRVGN